MYMQEYLKVQVYAKKCRCSEGSGSYQYEEIAGAAVGAFHELLKNANEFLKKKKKSQSYSKTVHLFFLFGKKWGRKCNY